jgi:Asp-tRNA(Asn)/Glu-tRNA(Gln) amidotransferase A subunit family amidase
MRTSIRHAVAAELPIWRQSAAGLLAAVRSGRLDPETLALAHLDRLAEREPKLRAWAWHEPEVVLEQARALRPGAAILPLQGIPVGVKDIVDTADMPTAYGSPIYGHHRPRRDAAVVARLRAAGAVVMGKTTTAEFAFASPPPTVNPHHPGHTPGGSSSGSAAAVADGHVPLAVSTQTGGSTIRPAAYCGIVGFKPSFGVLALDGVKPLAPSQDTLGLHARTVADVALLFEVLAGSRGEVAGEGTPAPLRLAFVTGPDAGAADAEATAALAAADEALRRDGASVQAVDLPPGLFGPLGTASRSIMAYEAARSLRVEFERHRDLLSAALIDLIEAGLATPESAYHEALRTVAICRTALQLVVKPFDCIVTFSAPGAAPRLEQGTGNSVFNRGWTAMHAPCLALPFGLGPASRLPVGVQLVAAPGGDRRLLSAARRIEAALQRSPFAAARLVDGGSTTHDRAQT